MPTFLPWLNTTAIIITILILIGFAIWITRKRENHPQGTLRRKVLLRKNVLSLVGFGYATVTLFFIFMCWKGNLDPTQAYDVIQSALMALIGGSLAIAKDLIPLGDNEPPSGPQDGSTGHKANELKTERHSSDGD